MSASGLAAHLSPAELGQRYRAARCPVERSHLQIVWLLSLGRSEREVAQVTGYGRRWVGEVARGCDYLRKLGHSAQVPRPRHAKAASPEEQAAYKKPRTAKLAGR